MTAPAPKPRGWWHAEARELRAEGWTQARIAERFGVSRAAVSCVVNPKCRERERKYQREYERERKASDPGYRKARAEYQREYGRKRFQAKAVAAGRAVAMTWADGREEVLRLRRIR